MREAYIVAAGRIVDGAGRLDAVEEVERGLAARGVTAEQLVIDPLEAGDTPVAAGHFRSGCAPIEALAVARRAILAGEARAFVIRGEDLLRTRYRQDKALRSRLMTIYGDACPIPLAYTNLARAFMRRRAMTQDVFLRLAAALYQNYVRTAEAHGSYTPPPAERFEFVTPLFRSVDCVNPVVDFTGRIVLLAQDLADEMNISLASRVRVAGGGVARTTGDGPEHLEEISQYEHLGRAYREACAQARIDFSGLFLDGRALLEVYTCFPVVPLAFLLTSGIAGDARAVAELLERHAVTVTGGMNIARAPWNNPALNAVIAMYETLCARSAPATVGAVHGNGGLGYRQGVAILGEPA